jgi:protein involved in polysaccharide export with SLBB domain
MRLLQCSVRHLIGIAGLAASALLWAGCGTTPPLLPPPPPDASTIEKIPFQLGDSLTVDLTGTPAPIPQSQFVLSGAGHINLPLLDTNIPAVGESPHELEEIIKNLYVPRYYSTISVTVTPGPRFYYVSGAVTGGAGAGSKQLYTGKVTVLGAIYTAGGFNDFAARRRVQLTRQDGKIFYVNCKKALKDPTLDLEVLPGDKIYVDMKTFWETIFGL